MRMFRAWVVWSCVSLLWAVSLHTRAGVWEPRAPETLHYTIRLAGLAVVDATFAQRIDEGDPQTRIIDVRATTKPFPSRIYRVQNRYLTWVDGTTGYPIRYDKVSDEAKFQEHATVQYAQEKLQARYSVRESGREWSQPLLGPTHNLFSALYAVREHDFETTPRMRFLLDAKGAYWQVDAARTRNLRTKVGFVWEVVVTFSLERGDPRARQSDLLTDNIVRGDKPLVLRIRPARPDTGERALVVRMEYEAKGFHLVATLDRF